MRREGQCLLKKMRREFTVSSDTVWQTFFDVWQKEHPDRIVWSFSWQ
jgi:hypothetical protein